MFPNGQGGIIGAGTREVKPKTCANLRLSPTITGQRRVKTFMAIQSLVLAPGVELVPDSADPLVARRSEITRDMLREGIRQLSQLERDALRLATRDKKTVIESAQELRTDVQTVETALRAGLLSLRASLLGQLAERGS